MANRAGLQARAEAGWPSIETLDRTDWVARMAAALAQGQVEAVRLTSAYLGAFLTLETGKRVAPPVIDPSAYAGLSRDGRPLSESLQSPLIGVLAALKDGKTPEEAIKYGRDRATRMVGVDYDNAHRTALMHVINEDDRFDGWSRSLAGTCGACASVASGVNHALYFEVHPGCQCVASPVVKGVVSTVAVLTGVEIFNQKTPAEQDEMLGPEAASLVREGTITLDDLRGESELESEPNFITQRPISALIH